MKLSRSQQEALLDMLDGRVLTRRPGFDWGATLDPHEIPGKRLRCYLGNVKTVTMNALTKRGLISLTGKLTFDQIYKDRMPVIYSITELGRKAVQKEQP